jgi:hypothetical protein
VREHPDGKTAGARKGKSLREEAAKDPALVLLAQQDRRSADGKNQALIEDREPQKMKSQ